MDSEPVRRRPTKSDALAVLKRRGLQIDNVIDVGIYEDTYELRAAFPDAFHLLFEPLAHLAPKIEENYTNVRHKLLIAGCSETPGQGHLQLMRHAGAEGPVTHSQLLSTEPAQGAIGEFMTIPVVRVDDAAKEAGLEGRSLLKVDVDGRDMDVLRGAAGILDQVDVVIVECLFLSWLDRVNFLYSHRFRLADVADIVYYDDMFWQMDMVFISERLASQAAFDPYLGGGPNLSLFKGFY